MNDARERLARVMRTRIAIVDEGLNTTLTDARLTSLALGTGVGVVTRSPIAAGRVGAGTGGDIAAAGEVTLITGGADDGACASARTCLATIRPRAGIAVVARCPIGFVGGRTSTGRRVASSCHMALIDGIAGNGRCSLAVAGKAAI